MISRREADAGVTIVRLVRNLAGEPFAWRADAAALARVRDRCLAALRADGWNLRALPARPAAGLRERGLLPVRPGESRAVQVLGAPGTRPLPAWIALVNGVDHLLVQYAMAGLETTRAAAIAMRRVQRLERRLAFARAPRWGWLASSPADCGAGLRVLWRLPLPPASALDRLAAAGLAGAPVPGGWLLTHRRPLGRRPARRLHRYDVALHPPPLRRLPRRPSPVYHGDLT